MGLPSERLLWNDRSNTCRGVKESIYRRGEWERVGQLCMVRTMEASDDLETTKDSKHPSYYQLRPSRPWINRTLATGHLCFQHPCPQPVLHSIQPCTQPHLETGGFPFSILKPFYCILESSHWHSAGHATHFETPNQSLSLVALLIKSLHLLPHIPLLCARAFTHHYRELLLGVFTDDHLKWAVSDAAPRHTAPPAASRLTCTKWCGFHRLSSFMLI